jgi:DNA-binding MarR family transcriptional regulator
LPDRLISTYLMASSRAVVPFAVTHQVRDTCLCLHLQRAARVAAHHFDQAFRDLELTNWQFSLLMSLNRGRSADIGDLSRLLGTDRTSVTASLKPLERRALVTVSRDPKDHRRRLVTLTEAGRSLLSRAVPRWRRTQRLLERRLVPDAERFRDALRALSTPKERKRQDGSGRQCTPTVRDDGGVPSLRYLTDSESTLHRG